ncbi:tetratricopeptide repeat protein [Microbacterium sp. SLBN-146]|uniref:tetratricopeptide repeat protein n=1 Tax=Microbacterium sp. SLBN-146 TaxID=2768457 RepID=UPI001154BE95|nr:tetratricopeptide repeat protein [Microbacterium sp. SLBN-146]TQJ32020.1 tetratricopeptide repeat protein [Microbacterium sp. SLBN-146]
MADWVARVAAVWADETVTDDDIIHRIDLITSEGAPDDGRALFERASARDAAGRESEAEPLYRSALAAGLDEEHRAQAVIQLASTLRNLERLEESRALLEDELDRTPPSLLRDEAAAFLALTLSSAGESARATAVALMALAPHLSRYSRSVRAYAEDLAATP